MTLYRSVSTYDCSTLEKILCVGKSRLRQTGTAEVSVNAEVCTYTAAIYILLPSF